MAKKQAKKTAHKANSKPATQADLKEGLNKLHRATQADLKTDLAKLRQDTQRDLETWGGQLATQINNLDQKIESVKDGLEQKIEDVKTEMTDELKRHFDAGVEIMQHDLVGANKDEISSIKDKVKEHDQDIAKIKDKVGILS